MKKFRSIAFVCTAVVMTAFFSCSSDDGGTLPVIDDGLVDTDATLTGEIAAQKLTADQTYMLDGIVSITSGELEIAAGTVIYGKPGSALVIGKDATIKAIGTSSNPIIFTSGQLAENRATGDWAGLVVVGKATSADRKSPVEGFPSTSGTLVKFGPAAATEDGFTIDDSHSSGTLSYIRIEYAGYELTPNNEINSLTLAGVGSGTVIDHIHIHASKDDAVEIFGGNATISYIVTTQTQDDDIDLDDGYFGTMQYGLVWRNAKITDQSGSSGLESGDKGDQAYTLSNFTFFGPLMQSDDYAGINYGVQLKGTSKVTLTNNIWVGWPTVTEGEKDAEFGTTMPNADLTFSGNYMVGGAEGEDSETGEASAQHSDGIDGTHATDGGYMTVFPASPSSLTGYSFSGYTAANITPMSGITAGATAGTDWNFDAGWILKDPASVSY